MVSTLHPRVWSFSTRTPLEFNAGLMVSPLYHNTGASLDGKYSAHRTDRLKQSTSNVQLKTTLDPATDVTLRPPAGK